MKTKTIKSVLTKKFESFVESIKDEKVKNLVKDNSIITGGCIASMLLGEKVNDYDVYFTNHETTKAVAEYYVNLFNKNNPLVTPKPKAGLHNSDPSRVYIGIKSSGVSFEDESEYHYFEQLDPDDPRSERFQEQSIEVFKADNKKNEEKYRPIFLTCNAITLSDSVQLIVRFYGEPEEIHKNYDFVHCTNYWTSKNRELIIHKNALISLMEKDLKYIGSLYPVCSIFRIRKFIKRGWTISAGQLFKIIWQTNKLDLDNFEVLKEQLLGVDVAYFSEILSEIKKDNSEKIDYTYISNLVDKIF
jgi:hypothetical protein